MSEALTNYTVTGLDCAILTSTSLSLRPTTTIDEARDIGRQLSTRATLCKLMLGDYFLALDQFEWGSQVVEDCGLDYSSVSQYRWVSSKIPPDLRDPSLPYSYHRAVAALSHEQIAYALQLAVEEALDWTQFQALVSEIKGTLPREPKPPRAIGAAIDHSNDAVGRLWLQEDADLLREYLA